MGQFVQQVYRWSPDWSAYVGSIDQVVTTLSMVTVVPFLIKVVKMRDIQLGIFGFTVTVFKNLIKGTWLKEMGRVL